MSFELYLFKMSAEECRLNFTCLKSEAKSPVPYIPTGQHSMGTVPTPTNRFPFLYFSVYINGYPPDVSVELPLSQYWSSVFSNIKCD